MEQKVEFNIRCLVALGCEVCMKYNVPTINVSPFVQKHLNVDRKILIHALKFDSDYNAAYTLMHYCHSLGIAANAFQRINYNGMFDHAFASDKPPEQPSIAKPNEISLACCEVLEEFAKQKRE